jgi:hypothetical protein
VNAAQRVVRVNAEYAAISVGDVARNPVAVIFRELTPVIRAMSLTDRLGELRVDPTQVNENMQKVHETIAAHLDPSKTSMVQSHAVSAPVTVPKVRQTRVASPKSTAAPATPGIKPLFRAGTLTATLYDRLIAQLTKDGGKHIWVYADDLLDGLSSGDPNALISDVIRKGKTTGAFSLTKQKNGKLMFELT